MALLVYTTEPRLCPAQIRTLISVQSPPKQCDVDWSYNHLGWFEGHTTERGSPQGLLVVVQQLLPGVPQRMDPVSVSRHPLIRHHVTVDDPETVVALLRTIFQTLR